MSVKPLTGAGGPRGPLTWAYGVTTVPARLATYLPRTLKSLAAGGFGEPWLFVDGAYGVPDPYRDLARERVTTRWPAVGCSGNWILAMWELWVRFPAAHRYALFQDDVLCVRGLREYLEHSPFPARGYGNLYTFLNNEVTVAGKPRGRWYEASLLHDGHNNPDRLQRGRGALGLVFDRDGVRALLGSDSVVMKPQDPVHGKWTIDGNVVTALNKAGFREYVHNPSLVQHLGDVTSLTDKITRDGRKLPNLPHPKALTFPGENYDARLLLPKRP